MPDLNREIDTWRQQLEHSGSISADDIAELESHLVQEIESLQKSGLRPDEALIIATRRLGHPHELAVEYAKNDALMSWKRPAKLMLWGMLVLKLLSLGSAVFYTVLTSWDARSFADSPWLQYWFYRLYWLSLLTQAGVLGLLWSLAENPQGCISRSLTWLEQTIRTGRGTFYFILAVVAFDLTNAALRLLQEWIRIQNMVAQNSVTVIGQFGPSLVVQTIVAEMCRTLPLILVLVVLIRTEGWKPFARLSTR